MLGNYAGISTQFIFEKRLSKTLGKARRDPSREMFLETVMDWKNGFSAIILHNGVRYYLIDCY